MKIDIVFDGLPGDFVDVEDDRGRSIKLGEWVHRPDGYWVIRFELLDHLAATTKINLLRQAARQVVDECGPNSTPSNGAIARLRGLLPWD